MSEATPELRQLAGGDDIRYCIKPLAEFHFQVNDEKKNGLLNI